MDFEALHKEVKRMWGPDAKRPIVEYLWERFVEDGMTEDQTYEFCHYYKEKMDMFSAIAARGGGSPPHSSVSEEPSRSPNKRKRGPYKKCLRRSLDVVCFVGEFRESHRGSRIPWQRLSPEWNRRHPAHRRSPDEMKMVYIRNRRACYVLVLERMVKNIEADMPKLPKQQVEMIDPFLETYRAAAQNPDAYRIDISGSADTGYGMNIYPIEMPSVTLEELRERYGEELAAPFAEHLRQKKRARP